MYHKSTFGNFYIELCRTTEGLLIQAEDLSANVVFSKVLNDQSVKGISKEQVFDIDTIGRSLKDCLERKPNGTSLRINMDGELSFGGDVVIGNLPKKVKFNIKLEKKTVDPVKRLERVIEILSTKVAELEGVLEAKDEIISRHEKFEKELLEKINKLEKTVERLEEQKSKMYEECQASLDQSIFEKMSKLLNSYRDEDSFVFDANGAFAGKYILSNNNKTAIAKTADPCYMFAKKPLLRGKKYQFSFIIEEEYWIMLGITPASAVNQGMCNNVVATFAYANTGQIYSSGAPSGTTLSQYYKEDKVTFVVDLDTGEIDISLNDKRIYSRKMTQTDIEYNEFYPFVFTNCKKGAGATLV